MTPIPTAARTWALRLGLVLLMATRVAAVDTDADGLEDEWELLYFPNLATATGSGNNDTDQLTNSQEQSRGTDPTRADTDFDGLQDHTENGSGNFNSYTSPSVANTGTNPTLFDTDGDGVGDGAEAQTANLDPEGTDGRRFQNPNLPDTDGDSLWDNVETSTGTFVNWFSSQSGNTGTFPNDSDSDDDGIDDASEAQSNAGADENYRTDPNNADTDGDGLEDLDELNGAGARPQTFPNNPDSDGDGLSDLVETNDTTFDNLATDTGTNPRDNDTDDDGLLDGRETNDGSFDPADNDDDTGTNPNLGDTDSDGLMDGVEVAGKTYANPATGITVLLVSDPTSPDGDMDQLPDVWELQYNLDPLSALGEDGADGNPDVDTKSNLQEFQDGTNPRVADLLPEPDPTGENPDRSAGLAGEVYAQQVGGANASLRNKSIHLDGDDTLYQGGDYKDQAVSFETPTATITLEALPDSRQAGYVAAQDPNGIYLWAARLSSDGEVEVNTVHVDEGFLYVGGAYKGGLLRLGADDTELPAAGNDAFQGFVLKLDAETGAFEWASANENLPADANPERNDEYGAGESWVYDLAVRDGNVYVCGDFRGNIKAFNVPTWPRNIGDDNEEDIFVAKLGEGGAPFWVNSGGGPDPAKTNFNDMREATSTVGDTARAIVVDALGAAYVAGSMVGMRKDSNRQPGNFKFSSIPQDEGLFSGYSRGQRFHGMPTWFVAKFNSGDGRMARINYERHNFDGTDERLGNYSRANDLILSNGSLYVAGEHEGFLEQTYDAYVADKDDPDNLEGGDVSGPGENVTGFDTTTAGTTDGFVLKLDTGLNFVGAEGVRSQEGSETVSTLGRDAEGNLYAGGLFGEGTARFTKAAFDPTVPQTAPTLFSLVGQSLFIGRLTEGTTWAWVSAPTSNGTSPERIESSGVAVNRDASRLYVTGNWGGAGQVLTVGSGDAAVGLTAAGEWSSFIYAVSPADGVFVEGVTVEIISPQAQPHVQPRVGVFSLFSGERFTASVPARVYEDPAATLPDLVFANLEDDDGDVNPLYRTRHTCTGYTIGDGIISDTGTRFEGVIVQDTIIEFSWVTDHVLTVDSDLEGTLAVNNAGTYERGPEGLGLTSTAAGNPLPEVRRHWIAEGELVTAFIDGAVNDYVNPGSRYVVTGYEASGVVGVGADFSEIEVRQQVPEFVMSGPGAITYEWKVQHRVVVSTSNVAANDLPEVRRRDASGNYAEVPVGSRGRGTGEHWYDRGDGLRVGARRGQAGGLQELTGWITATSPPFPVPERQNSLDGLLEDSSDPNESYFFLGVPALTQSITVAWNYNDTIFSIATDIGDPTDLLRASNRGGALIGSSSEVLADMETVPGSGVLRAPDSIRLIEGPPGTNVQDMHVWDELVNRSLPLRPGMYFLEWNRTDSPRKRIVRVTSSFPNEAHFTHLYAPEIPNVVVDPEPADSIAFLGLEYTNGDAVVAEGEFSSTLGGRAVLLFSRSDTPEASGGAATGDLGRETLEVRVVETKVWDEAIVDDESDAVIARPVPTLVNGTEYDSAGIGTGFVIHPNARYNANLHDRTRVADAGPVIPVNRHFNPPEEANGPNRSDLVVIWYERGNAILWPYSSIKYNAVWPQPLERDDPNPPAVESDYLRRIVIASRLGSEGRDDALRNQLSFRPDRFEQVRIYNQPRRDRPGFNPNEEHAVIAPSFKFLDQANPPATAYALRRDLNVTTEGPDYSSDPYVLVEYFDREAGENGAFRMAIYEIEYEDPTVATETDANGRAFPYVFNYPMFAGEPVQPPYPLGRVIGLTPCEQTIGFDLGPQRTYWEDHTGQPWAVSDGKIGSHFYYPQALDFWGGEGPGATPPGTCLPFITRGSIEVAVAGTNTAPVFEAGDRFTLNGHLVVLGGTTGASFVSAVNALTGALDPATDDTANVTAQLDVTGFVSLRHSGGGRFSLQDGIGEPLAEAGIVFTRLGVNFDVAWPEETPVLKAGETLTFQGGEWKADHPAAPGLPGVVGWAAGTVVYDSLNPTMSNVAALANPDKYTARIIAPLETLTVDLPLSSGQRTSISPATGLTRVDRTVWRFPGLSASLQRRIFYDPLDNELGIEGFVNNKTLGDASLTAAPDPVYVLEPNILSESERRELEQLEGLSTIPEWSEAIAALYDLGRDPNNLRPEDGYFAGLVQDTLGGGALTGREIDVTVGAEALDGAYFLLHHPDDPVWVWFEIVSDQTTGTVAGVSSDRFDAGNPGWTADEWAGDTRYQAVFTSGELGGRRFLIRGNTADELILDIGNGGGLDERGLAPGDSFVIVESGRRVDNHVPDAIAGSFRTLKVALDSETWDAGQVAAALRSAIDADGNYAASIDSDSGRILASYTGSPGGAQPASPRDATTGFGFPVSTSPALDTSQPAPNTAVPGTFLGPGLALVPGPAALDPRSGFNEGYVTIVENNDPEVGGPVSVFVIKVSKEHRYRGAVQTILSDNVFDEKITMRHTGDFGGNADDIVYQWFYREEDGTEAPLPPNAAWKLFPDQSDNVQKGKGMYQISVQGAGGLILADNLFFVRYRHINDVPAEVSIPAEGDPVFNGVEWGPEDSLESLAEPTGDYLAWWRDGIPRKAATTPGLDQDEVVGELFAGAGNSPTVDGEYRPQLVQGWVKRVLDRVNPYEARFNDFRNNGAPATYVSMVQQFGPPYVGPVALNSDKNVIENVGLLELYHTIFDRATSLSIDLSSPITTPGITNALLLAASRLSDMYTLLGNEAYSDAQDPTIGFGSNSTEYGYATPSIFCFQNQMATMLDEELALMRGVDESFARPVFNRLFPNFTKSDGEVAYALNYNITDQNADGFIDESDALILYPQGHGDAWGHYLSAMRQYYDLLKHPFFNWVSRSEQYNLLDIVIGVDFEDERKFAHDAASKARAGAEVVNETYRSRYVADPDGQWQGYSDPDADRAWGVQGWARRAGQGALFDWVTANAILPDDDTAHAGIVNEGLRKIDRKTVSAIGEISGFHGKIQGTYDDANQGLNPLGLADGVVPFDIDPVFDEVGSGIQGKLHFDQIYERAVGAAQNALRIFDYANEQENRVRQQQVTADDFRGEVAGQDRALRNELISIFGTPYEGTIGPGLPYPSGYAGPDLLLFFYVDVNEFSDRTIPQGSGSFAIAYQLFTSGIANIDGDFRKLDFPYFVNDVADPGDIDAATLESLIAVTPVDEDGNVTANIPVKANDYVFQAPAGWGRRAAPGELQAVIAEMLQAEADYALALSDYDNYIKELADMVDLLEAKNGISKDKLRLKTQNVDDVAGLQTGILVAEALASSTELLASLSEQVFLAGKDGAESITGTANSFRQAAAWLRLIWVGLDLSTRALQFGFTATANELGQEIERRALELDIDISKRDDAFEIRERIKEIEQHFRNEAATRIELFKRLEALREISDRYRATLERGIALIDQREAFNKSAASATQKVRYQDMAFRTFRNDALEKYRDSFELAARYTYLAAKAYDYDTNLGTDDPASALGLLDDIIRARHLGIWVDGEPLPGTGGLADVLAVMRDNYAVLRTQLGLNNSQQELSKMSLRQGYFRSKKNQQNNTPGAEISDAIWRQVLQEGRVANLWTVPEFRRFCRPPRSESLGALPGIVIEFPTEIVSGHNVFGWTLAGGDFTYDPTNFATKIRAAGVWFEGYDNAALSVSPRVYLVPAGLDIMSIPNSPELETRRWNVVDQSIPPPFVTTDTDLRDPGYIPSVQSLNGPFAQSRKFSRFRAYGDLVDTPPDEDQMTFDARLVGRSVWNTRWMLIITGETLLGNENAGLDQFINNVSDIKLFFNTLGYSGN